MLDKSYSVVSVGCVPSAVNVVQINGARPRDTTRGRRRQKKMNVASLDVGCSVGIFGSNATFFCSHTSHSSHTQ